MDMERPENHFEEVEEPRSTPESEVTLPGVHEYEEKQVLADLSYFHMVG